MADILHIRPVNDIATIQIGDKSVRATFEHDTSTGEPDCLCGPEMRPEKREDGSIGWLIVHHALDGRERRETPEAGDRPG